jgi:hypothetical protein
LFSTFQFVANKELVKVSATDGDGYEETVIKYSLLDNTGKPSTTVTALLEIPFTNNPIFFS